MFKNTRALSKSPMKNLVFGFAAGVSTSLGVQVKVAVSTITSTKFHLRLNHDGAIWSLRDGDALAFVVLASGVCSIPFATLLLCHSTAGHHHTGMFLDLASI